MARAGRLCHGRCNSQDMGGSCGRSLEIGSHGTMWYHFPRFAHSCDATHHHWRSTLHLIAQHEADLARFGLCQRGQTEPGASQTDDCREKVWCTRIILERDSPPTHMKRDANTLVKIEPPTTSRTEACSTDAGAGTDVHKTHHSRNDLHVV